MGLKISNLKEGHDDAAGQLVKCIYYINRPVYAVYRTKLRVMVHFSDDDAEAAAQRAALIPLAPLRGQINGLIDGWHDSIKKPDSKLAARLERRVADALVVALDAVASGGDVTSASALLIEVRDEIIALRQSRARDFYLLVASLFLAGGLLALLVAKLAIGISSVHVVGLLPFPIIKFAADASCPITLADILNGLGGGLLGSFFSVALGLRNRTVLLDFQNRNNGTDAVLRMSVGVIGALMMVCFLGTGIVNNVRFGEASLSGTGGWMRLFLMGFIAGFSERLIPDLLAKASLVQTAAASPQADKDIASKIGMTAKPHTAAPGANASSPGGTAQAAEDSCLCDAPPTPGEALTPDDSLPPATSGIAPPSSAQPDDPEDMDADPPAQTDPAVTAA